MSGLVINRNKVKYIILVILLFTVYAKGRAEMLSLSQKLFFNQPAVFAESEITVNNTFQFSQISNNALDTKKIVVKSLAPFIGNKALDSISYYMDTLKPYDMVEQPWEKFKTTNKASFTITYDTDNLFLKYYVKERHLKAAVRDINSAVHEDNCVEFFVSFGTDHYYNLEFNCLGSVKFGYGKNRNGRTLFSEEIINKIKMQLTIAANKGTKEDYLNWELMVVIPKEVFVFSSIKQFVGQKCNANFYKCGSELPDKHYLTWNMVRTEFPDFHKPEFFGELSFE